MFCLMMKKKKLNIENNEFSTFEEANFERIYLQHDYDDLITVQEDK